MLDASHITQDLLKSLLHYDASTGHFTWRKPTKFHPRLAGWRAGSVASGYVLIRVNGRKLKAHRLAWLYVYGSWPDEVVDHIDCNPLNNAIANLRLASFAQNNANARRKAGKVLPKGVRQNGSGFTARIRFGGRIRTIGTFATADAAAQAYIKEARALYGEFARAS